MSLKIYTDGSCIYKKLPSGHVSSDGPCGWAYAIIDSNFTLCDSGGEKISTHNRMEMRAVIEALIFITENYSDINTVEIFCDSKLVINCAQKLWKRKCNLDLWDNYNNASAGKNIIWHKIKSHSGIFMNDFVDILAKHEANIQKI